MMDHMEMVVFDLMITAIQRMKEGKKEAAAINLENSNSML